MRILGASSTAAYVAYLIILVPVGVVVWKTWRTSSSWPIRWSVLVIASTLATPYIMEYDLTLLALPIAIMAKEGMQNGWMVAERQMLVVLWALPVLMIILALYTSIQIAPIVLLMAMVFLVRREKTKLAIQ